MSQDDGGGSSRANREDFLNAGLGSFWYFKRLTNRDKKQDPKNQGC
jgi:hypothetical protein